MNYKFFYNLIVFSCMIFYSCGGEVDIKPPSPLENLSPKDRKVALENAMKRAGKKEQLQIKSYLQRHQIPASETATGVHYYIYENGEGVEIDDGTNVLVDYVVTKINGDTLYTTSKSLDEFVVAHSEKESGLHEAIKLLTPGDKAIIIIPSSRAHGISGDNDKVPPLTTVIYNIEVKAVL